MLRITPTLIGISIFAIMSALYLGDHGLYLAILRAAGISPQNIAFIDSQFLYAAKKCWDLGYDVYKEVPCYPIPGQYSYSPLWLRLPFLPADNDTSRVSIGLVTDILFILSIATLPAVRSRRETMLMTMALVSSAVIFALERNNVDVWMFLLVIAGGHLLTRTDHRRWAGYALFLLAGLLKYYPITLLTLALKEKPKQLLAVMAVTGCIGAAFLFHYHSEIVASFANIPRNSPFGDMVGIVNLPRTIATMASTYTASPSTPNPIIAPSLRLVLTALLAFSAIRMSRRAGFVSAWAQLPASGKVWLVIGCTVMSGCYFIAQNVSYRLIYLLIVLSGLFAFRRASTDARTTELITLAAILIVPTMWMEGLRHWADIAIRQFHIGHANRNLVVFLVWLFRELTWLYLATIMLAIVTAFITHSPFIQRVARNTVGAHG
jgi:hypothetical protein